MNANENKPEGKQLQGGMQEEGFSLFPSRARIDGQDVTIGVDESRALHRRAISRGMTTEAGELRPDLSWQERLVMILRQVTTPPDFNHEWWAAKTFEPDWVKKAEEIYLKNWLYFPRSVEDLIPRALGSKVGYYLTLSESQLELAATNGAYLAKVEQVELEKAQRGLEPEERKKMQVVPPGYDNWKQCVDESYKNAVELRRFLLSLVANEASLNESGEFLEGFAAGRKKAVAIDLKDELSDYNRTQDVIDILLEYWPGVAECPTRTEISRYIRTRLPDDKREHLKNEKAETWKSFCVWVRDIYDDIGLSPSGKGAPRKNREKEKE